MDRHRDCSQQVVRKGRVGELEVPLVVELQQSRRERMVVLQVDVVHLGLIRCVATLFANVHLKKREKKEKKINIYSKLSKIKFQSQ